MDNKIVVAKDVESLCEQIVRGHERRKRLHESRRLDIIYSHASGFAGSVGGARGNSYSDPCACKAERLEKLEDSTDARFIRAVEQSLIAVGEDVPRELRERLQKAVMLNCESGREYPYESLNIDDFSRRDFYRRRKRFIKGIGSFLGLE